VQIVVSGASGLVGSALVPALEAAGHPVLRPVRREPESTDEIAWDPAAGTIDAVRLGGVEASSTSGTGSFSPLTTSSRHRSHPEW
jgi:uncharacterized protein YbjT (DUF2867 family)